jgi:hypothetical protein
MAGVTGLEPAASCVTGKRSNQLSYTPKEIISLIIASSLAELFKRTFSEGRAFFLGIFFNQIEF